jgi:hypothetical protein
MRRLLWTIVSLLIPEHRYGRPGAVVTVLEWVRTAAAVWVVYVSVRHTGLDFERGLQRFVLGPAVNAGFAVPALLLGAVSVLALARDRRAQLRAFGRPAATVVSVLFLVLGLAYLTYVMGHEAGPGYWSLWLIFLVPVGFPALAVTAFLVVRYWFRAADGHPMLPALCAFAYAVTQFGILAVYGPGDTLPPPYHLLVGIGSPLSLAAVAGIELMLLHRAGVSPRTLPPLRPRPSPPVPPQFRREPFSADQWRNGPL